jgi:nicotinamidase-related amidase
VNHACEAEVRNQSVRISDMPATQLDRRTALIVIDLQKGIAAFPCAHPMAEVVEKASRLAAAFRRRDLPVVLVNVTRAAPSKHDAARFRRTSPTC